MSGYTERESRLAATLINVLVAGMCDPQRLSRGRTYARQGAVVDIEVEPGFLSGQVQGSRAEPYEVTVRVSSADQFGNLAGLVPTSRDLLFDCTCPDWDSPCKHAVAVMGGFAELVGHEPQLLATWRGSTATGSSPRATVGSRTNRTGPESPSSLALNRTITITDDARETLRQFLGNSLRFEPPVLTALRRPQADAWDDPWAAMLDDALSHLEQTPRLG